MTLMEIYLIYLARRLLQKVLVLLLRTRSWTWSGLHFLEIKEIQTTCTKELLESNG